MSNESPLEYKDDKAAFFMEIFKNFSFINARSFSPANAQFLQELKESVEGIFAKYVSQI